MILLKTGFISLNFRIEKGVIKRLAKHESEAFWGNPLLCPYPVT